MINIEVSIGKKNLTGEDYTPDFNSNVFVFVFVFLNRVVAA